MPRKSEFRFVGGPLDGQSRPKGARGRWPAGVDAQGKSLPIDAVDRRIRNENIGFYANARPVPTLDGSIVREYEWWPAKESNA